MDISNAQELMHNLAKEKGFWDGDNHNIPEKLMLIVSELGEALEALRKDNRQPYDSPWVKDSFADELADAVIRIMDLCAYLNIDLNWQIKQKYEYNKNRPYKHGKAF